MVVAKMGRERVDRSGRSREANATRFCRFRQAHDVGFFTHRHHPGMDIHMSLPASCTAERIRGQLLTSRPSDHTQGRRASRLQARSRSLSLHMYGLVFGYLAFELSLASLLPSHQEARSTFQSRGPHRPKRDSDTSNKRNSKHEAL